MKKNALLYTILIFVLAQLAWFLVIILWIYRFVINNMIFRHMGENPIPELISKQSNLLALIGGLLLMVSVSVAMSLIFRWLTSQMKITSMYDNFIANVTHELKSPLSSIQLGLETLQVHQLTPEKQEDFLNLMIRDAGRLHRLINSILDITGLEQKKFVFNYHVVTAGPTLCQVVEDARTLYKLSADAITITGEANHPCVIDQNAMSIVINNLMDNAIKYSNPPVKIDIALSFTKKFVRMIFRDHGVGIASRDMKKIFQKFYRVYRNDIPSVKGSGLGLTWVREIVKAHGGKIQVHSDGPGKGCRFTIDLPIYQTTKKRYIDQLLKITQKRKKMQEETHDSE